MARYEDWDGRIEASWGSEADALPPHEMTREQFEHHPDTLWHASPAGKMGDGVIHFGTQKAAYEALTANMGGGAAHGLDWQPGQPTLELQAELAQSEHVWRKVPKGWHDEPAFIALIVDPERTADMIDVHEAHDRPFHDGALPGSGDELANELVSADGSRGYWYLNECEDIGSWSGCVPGKAWLCTHEQLIERALAAGEFVPEHVLAEYPHLVRPHLDDLGNADQELEAGLHDAGERGPEL
jgi:hypothetical protein